jgi:hypothetical protein
MPHIGALLPRAQMAELVDAPASGAGDRKVVEVRVLFWAPFSIPKTFQNHRQNGRKLPICSWIYLAVSLNIDLLQENMNCDWLIADIGSSDGYSVRDGS